MRKVKERRLGNAVIRCDKFFYVGVDEIREESVLGGGKCDIIGPVDVAQLNGYGGIAVFHD